MIICLHVSCTTKLSTKQIHINFTLQTTNETCICFYTNSSHTSEVRMMLHVILLALMLALLTSAMNSTDYVIAVHCCPRMENCSNITDALIDAQAVNGTIEIHIQPCNYTLSGSYQLQYKSGISITGSGEDSTVLNCDGTNSGIAFINSIQIAIHNLSIVGCGAKHINTGRNTKNHTEFLQVALYFELCINVTMSNILILRANGTGLVFLDTVGRVEISNSEFSSGGGGLHIEFTSNVSRESPAPNNSTATELYATYIISGCNFLDNSATLGNATATYIAYHCNDSKCFPFGRGGGMAVYFSGNASKNSLSVCGCTFAKNSAERAGGGIFVAFLGNSKGNKVQIISSTFHNNNCSRERPLVSRSSIGGGVNIIFDSLSHDNQAIISRCNFTNNSAQWGGGISLYSDTVPQGERAIDLVEIRNCKFEENIARIGTALDMFCQTFDNITFRRCSLTPEVIDCIFLKNGRYSYKERRRGIAYTAVNLDHLPAIFRDNVTFYDNEGSALGVRETVVQVMPSTFLNFTRNTGRNGGGIVFTGNSWMVLNENTHVIFDSNAAIERGGAIYATQFQNLYSIYSYSCFIRYIKPGVHPDDWIATLYFKNNTEFALGRTKHSNSIYASSIFPCVWPSSPDSDIKSDINATFCDWNSWEFDTEGNCTADITTSAGYFGINEYNIAVYAGIPQPLGVQVYDDFNQPVTNRTLFTVSGEQNTHLPSMATSNNMLIVHGTPNTSSSILLQTSDTRTVYTTINIELLPCPPGYRLENSSIKCTCQENPFAGYVSCHQSSNSSIFVGNCISYSEINIGGNSSKQVIVARCPFFAGSQVSNPRTLLPMNINNLDEDFCRKNWCRTGKLCNECINGTGISVFSSTYNCTECTESVTNWLIYIAVTILPLTLFFIIVVIFHVGVTSPQANGYIFFSQIITIPLQELIIESAWALALKDSTTTQHVLTDLLLFPYSVWSLDFFRIFYARDICLHKSMRIIHVLALQYIPALYPLCLVIFSYILIELHARNCRPVVWLWKPFCFLCVRFRRNWEAKTSIIDAFATFLVLSYTKILVVSISLVTPSEVYIRDGSSVGKILNYDPSVDFFQGDHLPYAILALVILVTIGAIPPLLLLLYPSHTFQRFLSFFKLQSHGLQAFVDAFQGCYKNGADGGPERRYFAGIYFVFRIIVFLVFTVVSSIQETLMLLQVTYTILIVVFVILHPYKEDRYNILDTIFISILAVSNIMILYLYNYLLINGRFVNGLWYCAYALLYLPTLYMASYIIYWFFIRSKCIQARCTIKLKQHNEEYDHLMGQASNSSRRGLNIVSNFPDRVENPHRYETQGP